MDKKECTPWLLLLLALGLWVVLSACVSGAGGPAGVTPAPAASLTPDLSLLTQPAASVTPEMQVQPETRPTATPQPYIVEPDGQREGWNKYTHLKYGFSFSFPADWDVYTRANSVWIRQGNQGLNIGVKWVGETARIQRTGVGAGELVAGGTVNFLGQELSKSILVYNGYDVTVLYNSAVEQEIDGRIFTVSLDYFDEPFVVITEEVQETADTILETFKLTTPATSAPPVLPDPQPGWAWYYTDFLGFAIPYPETWQTGPLRAPGSNSQIRVGAKPLPAGEDWLEWLRDNQREIFYTTPVSRDMVQANATVQGRPAFFRFAEGGGSSQMLLAFPDGDRVVYFYFHRGAGWEAEKRIFRTIVENLVWADGPTGETILPSGWEDGHVKTLFYDLAYPAEPLPPLHELEGTLAEWNTPVRNGVLLADDGQRYSVNAYHLGLVPNTENIEVGERVIITHYDMLDDPETIQPELIAVEWDGGWQLVLHKAYFDLTREALDAALIGRFPPDVRLQIRGSLAEVQPLLVDEEERSFPAGMWSLDPSSLVQAHGRAINPGDDLRLRLDYLYVSDNGGCLSHAGGGEECFYWHQVYPPVQPTTITATLRAVVPEANVLVLEEPVEGYITITPAAEGSPLAWEELSAGMQVMATGTAGPAGTLLAERVQVIMGVDEGE